MHKNYRQYPCKEDVLLTSHNDYTHHEYLSEWHKKDALIIKNIVYYTLTVAAYLAIPLVLIAVVYKRYGQKVKEKFYPSKAKETPNGV